MKQIILLLAIILFLSSCRIYYSIGQSESEFLKKNNIISWCTVSANSTWHIYRSCNQGGAFYYFKNGYLDHMDMGEYVPDIIIENK